MDGLAPPAVRIVRGLARRPGVPTVPSPLDAVPVMKRLKAGALMTSSDLGGGLLTRLDAIVVVKKEVDYEDRLEHCTARNDTVDGVQMAQTGGPFMVLGLPSRVSPPDRRPGSLTACFCEGSFGRQERPPAFVRSDREGGPLQYSSGMPLTTEISARRQRRLVGNSRRRRCSKCSPTASARDARGRRPN